jgi:F0F1-type ATP synthase assembly protein I
VGVKRNNGLERKILILGWLLFIVSAVGFIASSLRSGDLLGLIGGVFFLLACFVFLVPFFWKFDPSD